METNNETRSLGLAILVAESEDGNYLPIGVTSTLREAREVAQDDFTRRLRALEKGGSPFCPTAYSVWEQAAGGSHRVLEISEPLQGF
jgi:hypothetical protein